MTSSKCRQIVSRPGLLLNIRGSNGKVGIREYVDGLCSRKAVLTTVEHKDSLCWQHAKQHGFVKGRR